MKVLQIATHDNFGGAARAAYRQHLALLAHGIESRMLVRHKATGDPAVVVFQGRRGLRDRVARTLRRKWIGFHEKKSRFFTDNLVCGLTDPRADLLRESTDEIAKADVINFHKTEHFADIPALLYQIPSDKPVVVTLHDLSPITGGCDYPVDCRRFESGCGYCPLLHSSSQGDYSRRIFLMRKMAYASREPKRFAFAANSRWTAGKAKVSGLTQGHRVEVVHFGLDQKVYSAIRRQEARRALGIDLDQPVIAFAAHDLSLKHKGGYLLQEALNQIQFPMPIRLLTMGAGRLNAAPQFHHTHFGRIESDELQAIFYRAADVFVIPSLEEAFGQTALEAVACGTVVAGFNTGGVVDIVCNDLNGRLVERENSAELSEAITDLLTNKELRAKWQKSSEAWIQERFSYTASARTCAALYESLLS